MSILLSLAFAGCTSDSEDDDAELTAVTSLGVLADIVREIGGERVQVHALLPPGSDPHTYEPVPGDVRRVTEADIVFINGLGIDENVLKIVEPNLPDGAPLVELAEVAGDSDVTLLKASEGEDEHEGEEEDDHGGLDPHLWLNVDNTRVYTEIIRDRLVELDPDGTDAYEGALADYLAQLEELDTYVQEAVSQVPEDSRKIVSTHAAFGYMAEYMGFEIAGVVSTSPGQEPSASDIRNLQDAIRTAGVRAVFQEPQLGSGSGTLEQAADDVGVDVCTLYSDSLDDDVPTYLDLMRHNADELVRCLGEDAG